VRQGAFGSPGDVTPSNDYAWSLEVPLGTTVHAAEGGTVLATAAKGKADGGCDAKAAGRDHYVRVEHEDHTVAEYRHVRPLVAKGAHVRRGEPIGVTDRSGVQCYPHLRFEVFATRAAVGEAGGSIPLYFDQIPGGLLREGFRFTDRF
jgi:murein DD-endopeptidase MepM/ murein hydrolase activator NlpD